MDTGITNVSRSITPVQPELDVKKQSPTELQTDVTRQRSMNPVDNSQSQVQPNENRRVDENSRPTVEQQELDDMVSQINEALQNEKRSIQFNVDEDSGRTVITIKDINTGQEIKQIPAEEVLRISRQLSEQFDQDDLSGMLIRSQV